MRILHKVGSYSEERFNYVRTYHDPGITLCMLGTAFLQHKICIHVD